MLRFSHWLEDVFLLGLCLTCWTPCRCYDYWHNVTHTCSCKRPAAVSSTLYSNRTQNWSAKSSKGCNISSQQKNILLSNKTCHSSVFNAKSWDTSLSPQRDDMEYHAWTMSRILGPPASAIEGHWSCFWCQRASLGPTHAVEMLLPPEAIHLW